MQLGTLGEIWRKLNNSTKHILYHRLPAPYITAAFPRRKMETGKVVVEKIGGKSTVIRCFSKYPLKIIIPNKVNFQILIHYWNLLGSLFVCLEFWFHGGFHFQVGSSQTDAVWIYTITYGGGIVSVCNLPLFLSLCICGCTVVFFIFSFMDSNSQCFMHCFSWT